MASEQGVECGGRPQTVIAMDIGGTKISGAVLRMADDPHCAPVILYRSKVSTRAQEGACAIMRRVIELAHSLVVRANMRIAAIGIASAGVIGTDGSVISATDILPGWSGVQLKTKIESATGLHAAVIGDVHAHALGEARWGAGRSVQSMLLAAIGTGVGGAFVHDGSVLKGYHGMCGHIGHVQCCSASQIRCSCGRYGHVESVSSGMGIERIYERMAHSRISAKEIAAHSQQGEPTALAVLRFAGRNLGRALGSQSNVLDPQTIVLSGSVCNAGEEWLAAVHEGFQEQAMDLVADTPILIGELGDDAPLMGAAAALESTQHGKR